MFDTYKPSGRISPMFLPWLAIGSLMVVAAAFVYQLGLHWIPLIYINLLLTLVMGVVVGFCTSLVVKAGKVRNTPVAFLILLLLVATAVAAKFGFQYMRMLGEVKTALATMTPAQLAAETNENLTPEQMDDFRKIVIENYSFKNHIDQRVESGWQIGKVGRANDGNPISGIVVYIVWAIEAGTILYISGKATATAVKQPFSEKMGVWADENEVVMTLPVTNEEMVAKIKSATSVQELLELPIPKSDESNQFAVYTVHSVPGQEMEDAYLTVELQTHTVNAKGENQVASKALVRNAILSSAQRTHLKDNAEIMNEAFAAYRASLLNPEKPAEGTSPS